MNEKQKYGQQGEDLACKYLKKHCYKILERNFRCPLGELDVVALHKGVLVFIEVKARNTLKYGRPADAVDEYKQQKLKRLAELYINMHNKLNMHARFDVVEVLGGEVNLIQNAWTL